MTEINEGQIWREVDPRFERFVRVEGVRDGRRRILVRTVVKDGDFYSCKPGSRPSWCDRERFNGKRGGYAYVETRL